MSVRWFYVSTSQLVGDDIEEQVRDIVNVSVPRNRSLGVTGALLFTGRRFSQYLEGTPQAIAELQLSIIADPRHKDVRTIASGLYSHRKFLTWSLAYAGPSQFVAAKVEAALTEAVEDGEESIEALAELLVEFTVGGRS